MPRGSEIRIRDEPEERNEREIGLERAPGDVERRERHGGATRAPGATVERHCRGGIGDDREERVRLAREEGEDAAQAEPHEPNAIGLEPADEWREDAADDLGRSINEERQMHRERGGDHDDGAPQRHARPQAPHLKDREEIEGRHEPGRLPDGDREAEREGTGDDRG